MRGRGGGEHQRRQDGGTAQFAIETARGKGTESAAAESKMKYLAAYLLLSLAGEESPSKEAVTSLLSEQGVEVDAGELDTLFGKLEGKSVKELIAEGKEKLLSIGGGGGGGAGAAAGGAGGEAEEEAEEEEEEEEVDVGGGDLFGGDGGGY
ncbi:60S acidic ribosomal protein P2 [Hondaea fermentalgiana]|uniref:60S acidic ribosomal protein P2 n=1 Tax=Hondaea fermentalgiana TaxID=2315210 RepID=A0A2R5GVA9_9STRA|nr:60S acidic ribosomal protein P2 [Hondaea fermentalgiana]|eukprot:GBG31854.1 60S acidic ribosomal protein P2 [Hondaea fermentalgiana]